MKKIRLGGHVSIYYSDFNPERTSKRFELVSDVLNYLTRENFSETIYAIEDSRYDSTLI